MLFRSVLISAARSVGPDRVRALELLGEPDRVPLTSPFVHLEVVPKATFFKKRLEQSFYDRYFANAVWFREVDRSNPPRKRKLPSWALAPWTPCTWRQLTYPTQTNSSTEKPNKAIHRSSLVKII